ncbi:hypothetical protein [Tessaracoccus palaemonis]|uniref:Uncharacterized protein n=1 Tax=Tessaracoccus palaemonis TaxID=2829499 RepID=A0ABX8SJB6_9ACTN|nr:hypothetical protein [Tessaracoccus palaemonis]QXT62755.1 hypothetical protein KDB89_13630 [Tessaracoccus palaemonis]
MTANLIRVRDKRTGHEITINKALADDHYELVNEPAVDGNGKPRAPKPATAAPAEEAADTPPKAQPRPTKTDTKEK